MDTNYFKNDFKKYTREEKIQQKQLFQMLIKGDTKVSTCRYGIEFKIKSPYGKTTTSLRKTWNNTYILDGLINKEKFVYFEENKNNAKYIKALFNYMKNNYQEKKEKNTLTELLSNIRQNEIKKKVKNDLEEKRKEKQEKEKYEKQEKIEQNNIYLTITTVLQRLI